MLRRFNLLLLATLLIFSVVAWPSLPERIPTHFGPAGEPDAWTTGSAWSWFLLPAIAVLTVLLMHWSTALIQRRPDMLNMPSKKQFLALPREDQQPILEMTAHAIDVVNTMVVLLFLVIQYSIYRAAFGDSTRSLMMLVLGLSVVGMPAVTIWLLARTSSMVSEAHRRARARGTIPGNS